jgi:hypothetical protein
VRAAVLHPRQHFKQATSTRTLPGFEGFGLPPRAHQQIDAALVLFPHSAEKRRPDVGTWTLLKPCSYRFVRAVLVGAFAANAATAGVLYTISPDSSFLPRSFTALGAGDEASVFNLGDGSLAFNGGLAYRATDGRFYAVANDGSGNSALESFTPAGAGTLTLNMSLGMGFFSGLAFDSSNGDLYAVADDPISGDSSLDRISLGPSSVTPVVDLGVGFEGGGLFTGGLTFNPANGLF